MNEYEMLKEGFPLVDKFVRSCYFFVRSVTGETRKVPPMPIVFPWMSYKAMKRRKAKEEARRSQYSDEEKTAGDVSTGFMSLAQTVVEQRDQLELDRKEAHEAYVQF